MTETWPFKDIDSRPKKGRFFPISFAEAARSAKGLQLVDSNGTRVRICFLNADDTGPDLLFAEYRPGTALFLYSWPDQVMARAAEHAVVKSFSVFAPLKKIRVPNEAANFAGCYLLRFRQDGKLRLTECRIHFEQRKYGGGQSFSTVCKRRVKRVEERELPLPQDADDDSHHPVAA